MGGTRSPVLFWLIAVVALAACSGDGDSATPTPAPSPPVATASPAPAVTVTETVAPPSPAVSAAQPSPATSRSPAATQSPEGCPSNGRTAPESAGGELVGDFDGDGASDRVGFDSAGTLTFATASGFVASLELGIPPNRRALAVADPQEDGQTFVFLAAYPREGVGDGPITITLATLIDCEPQIVSDADGETYVIEYGLSADDPGARGFGCINADDDGQRDLVGLVQYTNSDTGERTFERTVIELDGGVASNGATDSGDIPEGSNAPLASCGNQVFELG